MTEAHSRGCCQMNSPSSEVYPNQEAAHQAVSNFLVGKTDTSVMPIPFPALGLLGYSALGMLDGVECALTASWSLVPGRSGLDATSKLVKTLDEMDLPEGKFYPCDDPLSRHKGYVVYDWAVGESTVWEISLLDLVNPGKSALQRATNLTKTAESNLERDFGPVYRALHTERPFPTGPEAAAEGEEFSHHEVYPDRESASRAVLEFLAGQNNPRVIRTEPDCRLGIVGYSAFYEKDGVEHSLWAHWPLVPGTWPLTTTVRVVKTLDEMDLPEGKFYLCDNLLALRKGFVVHDWEARQAIVWEVPISELKRMYPPPTGLINSLTATAEANQDRDFWSPGRPWFMALQEAVTLGEPIEWVNRVHGELVLGRHLVKACILATEDLRCLKALDEAAAL